MEQPVRTAGGAGESGRRRRLAKDGGFSSSSLALDRARLKWRREIP